MSDNYEFLHLKYINNSLSYLTYYFMPAVGYSVLQKSLFKGLVVQHE